MNPLHAGEGSYPGFETQGRRHQKCKTGVLQNVSRKTKGLAREAIVGIAS